MCEQSNIAEYGLEPYVIADDSGFAFKILGGKYDGYIFIYSDFQLTPDETSEGIIASAGYAYKESETSDLIELDESDTDSEVAIAIRNVFIHVIQSFLNNELDSDDDDEQVDD